MLEQGMEKGIQLEKKHIAANILAEGQTIAFVAKMTVLSKADI